jgi:microcin C transport system substrate-binding protein
MRAIAILLLSVIATPVLADAPPPGQITRSNAIAVLAKPALPPDFPYFPYVNLNAPQGWRGSLIPSFSLGHEGLGWR